MHTTPKRIPDRYLHHLQERGLDAPKEQIPELLRGARVEARQQGHNTLIMLLFPQLVTIKHRGVTWQTSELELERNPHTIDSGASARTGTHHTTLFRNPIPGPTRARAWAKALHLDPSLWRT